MDFSVDTPLLSPPKEYTIAFGHLKLIRDKSANGEKEIKETKNRVSSKLPRTVRNIVGGNAAGTSRQIQSIIKSKTDTIGCDESSKPSFIPRRKYAKELPNKEPFKLFVNKNIPNRQKPLVEPRNFQRVQHLNVNQDFCPEPPKAVTPARPIPTLGHIYGQDPSNDSITDWYLESVNEYLDTPQESIESNGTTNTVLRVRSSGSNRIRKENSGKEPNSFSKDDSITTDQKIHKVGPLNIFKTTDENVRDWISSELDHSPKEKDDESGCRSISPPNRTVTGAKPNNSTILKVSQEEKHYVFTGSVKKSVSTTAIHNQRINSDVTFGKKSSNRTLIISKGNAGSKTQCHFNTYVPKVNTDIKPLTNSRPDIHKPFKYPSTPNPTKIRETFKIPVASYVEYPSEVLQKTTNFETEAGAYVSPSNTGGDFESFHKYSSQWTLDHVDEYSVPTDETAWSREQSSSFIADKSWRDNSNHKSETSRSKCPDKYSTKDYYNHYCWRKEVAKKTFEDQYPWDRNGRCKICQKYRHWPNRIKCNEYITYIEFNIKIHVDYDYGQRF